MIFKTQHFLFLLLILPILGKIMARAQHLQAEAAEKLRGKRTLSSKGGKKTIAFQLGSFALLILALAQPAWNPRPGPLGVQGRDLIIALDISRSMLANDVFPSRLEAAKISLHESLDLLRGQKIGLITFAGAASVRVPLTLDHHFVRTMLERAQPSDAKVGSTSLQAAIEKAVDIALSESKRGQQDIILFTDGEDHISNIETTSNELRDCGARVLIIGLGDPVTGAKVPGIGTNTWMRYKGKEVITRLDDNKLQQLSAESPNVIYYAAQNRPFDLITLYREMIADTSDLPINDETQLIYTEGYPLFIALALLLWLAPLNKRLLPTLAVLFLAGCSPEPLLNEQLAPAQTAWIEAQDAIETDPATALLQLTTIREQFLQAAMLDPGNREIAQQIAGVSAQINTVKLVVQAQEAAEKDLQQKLQEAIEQLNSLTQREAALSEQSQQLLRKRPPATPEEKALAATPALIEQTDIGTGTQTVLEIVSEVQAVIQNVLASAFGDGKTPPPTEFDGALEKLTLAKQSQADALQHLTQDAVSWPQINSAFLSATRQMQDALRLLSQSQGQNSEENSESSDENEMDWDFEEEMDWSESDMPSDMSLPMESDSFKTALENRSLPTPNYTPQEILMEEAANMKQRAQQQSDRAGAKVEKNW